MAAKLVQIRALMKERKWDLYLLPRTDQHSSQYIAPEDERVEFISGFSGSNAIALISAEEALLWTDGRYFLQAEKQLKEGWQMRKLVQGQKLWHEHAISKYPEATIGIDPRLITADFGKRRIAPVEKAGLKVELSIENLVDLIWTDKPKGERGQIYVHEEWAGKPTAEKVAWVRAKIIENQGKSAIFNDLSEISWVLNIRSSDIPFNPFFKGVLIIKLQGGSLYLPKDNPSLSSAPLKEYLSKVKISVQPYEPIFQERALITKSTVNYYIYNSIVNKEPIQWQGIGMYRAVRTQKEMNGFRRCHVVDGVAMAKFWNWRSKLDKIDDYQAAQYLNNLRYKQEHNKGLSFETISGGGPNAAVIHYHPTADNHAMITKDMIHLVDSGGQYLDGTTDVTRTFHFGNPTPQEKDSYTRVLLGVIDIERLKMPPGKITGGDIDILARRHLWAVGKDYCHGTGHGVGHFQGVHEGPVAISKYNTVKYEHGMIVTVEPGYYQDGQYGIRIENMVLAKQENNWVGFQNLTICPYDRQLIDLSILSKADIEFLDTYHKRVWNVLSPLLKDDEDTLKWLKQATEPLK